MAKRYPKKVNVIAEPNPQKPDGVEFRMEDEDGCLLETLVFSKDDEPGMGKGDEHELRFKLIQQAGMTLEFAQSPAKAFWVAWGTEKSPPPCPDVQPSAPDPILYAEKSAPNSLRVVNKNPCKQFFSFALNFVDPQSSEPIKLITYDPVGENKNGGIGGITNYSFFSSPLTLVLGATALLALGAYLWMR